jgi:L-ribulose-5-phosphate 3-epimerase
MKQNRREFISSVVAAGAVLPVFSEFRNREMETEKYTYPIRLFSKPLDNYDFDFLCECVSLSGIGGIDLTVRPGGKVEPEKVETMLPALIKHASTYKLEVDMIVTAITGSTKPFTENILRTASASGVKYYRLGWFEYGEKTGVWETIQNYKAVFSDLARINKKYNIHGGYQNHSGKYIGAPVWDLYELFHDIQPEYLGSQYDVRHAMVEGTDTWALGMKLISKHIRTLALKDFTWRNVNGKPEPVTVPLGEGMVDWDLYFQTLKDLKIKAPITLHIEYPLLDKGEEQLSLSRQKEIITGKIRKDADFIKEYIAKYQPA